MAQIHAKKGMVGMGAILAIVGILLLGGIGYAVMQHPMPAKEAKQENAESAEGTLTKEQMEAMEKNETMEHGTKEEMAVDRMMEEGTGTMPGMEHGYATSTVGTRLGGRVQAPLLDFTKAGYNEAEKSGKLVALYFYANWCPLCKAEFPLATAAFDALPQSADGRVIGFRVNFKDSDTDTDEQALAARFGVAYQHTKVFVKDGTRLLKAPDSWDTARYLSEIAKYQ